jgi:hypothetical protein
LVRNWARRALGASVVDGDVYSAEPRNGLVNVLHVIFVSNVGANELGLRTERAELHSQRLSGVVATANNNEIGAVFLRRRVRWRDRCRSRRR